MLSIPLLSIDHESNLLQSVCMLIYTRYKKTANVHDILITVSVFFAETISSLLYDLYVPIHIQNVIFIFYTRWKLYNDKIQKRNRMACVKIFIYGSSLLHIYDIITRVQFYNMVFGLLLYLLCLSCKYGVPCTVHIIIYSVCCGLRKIAVAAKPEIREQNPIAVRRTLSSCTYNKSVLYNIIVIIVLMYEFGRVLFAVNLRVPQLLSFV